jgi:hypothetical protein
MLRLNLPTESYWVDCPHGVRLLCRPLTTATQNAAGARAARRLNLIREATPEDPRVADPDMERGHLRFEAHLALAEYLVEAWEGVGNADLTEPAPLSPEGLRALLSMPEIAEAFNLGIATPLARMVAEGNA